ncbi:iron complex transport system substrate-binding protein [Parafrankia irregularis]|uniref:Iron complex transport system substrate-binding protein n=1 Tax=Parafrankia irregularis TaxID=795642 RepID=A0A0S4QMF2_9ACTN|nr:MULTISPECIES: ABC transporter substrate-binding protein [Parafrankia]MBE3200492.1 ABC transporter substrate-binding protein [Parafrankia sp. CH37]CUU56821.1 iron complex transport system substrate-binding protein [Parafrankia irregularis]
MTTPPFLTRTCDPRRPDGSGESTNHRRGAPRRVALAAVTALSLLCAALVGCSPSPTTGEPAAASGTQAARHEITVVDDAGREVEITVPVRRVVAFNTFNVEFIRAVGAFDAVVGLDEGSAGKNYTGYWGDFDITKTAGKGQAEPNYEQLAALKPEVVIFPRNGAWKEAEGKLAAFGVKTLVITGWDQNDHIFNVDLIGKIFDRQEQAAKLNAFYTKYRDLLTERLAGVTPRRVYLENDKDFASPVPGSGWHDMVTLAGGTNIFGDIRFTDADSARGSVHQLDIDPEAVLDRDPELIVRNTGRGYALESAGDLAAERANLLGRAGWDGITAVRDGQVYVTSSFPMNACSKIIGSLYLASWLHPDKMAGVDPDAVMKEWIETYQGVPLPDPAAYRLHASA